MNFNIMNKEDELAIKLVHYFITVENYTPIVVRGVKDEVWLENLNAPYRIIRINSNYIHNKEQYDFDIFKIKQVMGQIKKKTLSFNINTLNILMNVGDNVGNIREEKNISSIKIGSEDNIYKNENILEVFPRFKNEFLKDKEGLDLIVNVTNDINTKTIKDNEVFASIFKPKQIIVTPILIAICILVFICMYIFGNGSEDNLTLLLFGANYRPLVKEGLQLWRLITSMFLHIGIVHLFFNMYALLVIGKSVESTLGKWRFLAIYLISGMVGSLFSVVLNTSISAGASGAIFGLMGALLYFGYHYRLYLGSVIKSQIIPVIALNLIIGFMMPGVDNFAHIGGLIGGYLTCMALGIPGKKIKKDQINGAIVLILLIAFLGFMLFRY